MSGRASFYPGPRLLDAQQLKNIDGNRSREEQEPSSAERYPKHGFRKRIFDIPDFDRYRLPQQDEEKTSDICGLNVGRAFERRGHDRRDDLFYARAGHQRMLQTEQHEQQSIARQCQKRISGGGTDIGARGEPRLLGPWQISEKDDESREEGEGAEESAGCIGQAEKLANR